MKFGGREELTIRKRNGDAVPFNQARIRSAIRKAVLAVEVKPKQPPEKIADEFTARTVSGLEASPTNLDTLTVEDVQKAILKVLHEDAKNGAGALTSDPLRLWEAYLFYSMGRKLVREGLLPDELFAPKTIIDDSVRHVKAWNRRWDCDSTEKLNEWYRGEKGKDIRELMDGAEKERAEDMRNAAKRIQNALEEKNVRLIAICGPSSSGKTTTIRSLLAFLSQSLPNLRFQGIEVDNYFMGWDRHPVHSYNVGGEQVIDYDYEKPAAYQVDLLNEHLALLLNGKRVLLPEYDFRAGRSYLDRIPFRLEEGAILLLDCLHAIHPMMTASVPRQNKMIVYTEAMNMIRDADGEYVRWTDVRLMRRALRDPAHRGIPKLATFWHWWLVRQGEAEMLPFIKTADLALNGGHPCELPIYKRFLHEALVREMLPVFEKNPDLYDALARARRIDRLLGQVETASDAQVDLVPRASVLREFIGGSAWFEGL